MRFKRGDVVIYVGKSLAFSEPQRIGQMGIVSSDKYKERCVDVAWFSYPGPVREGGAVFPANIELLGHVELEEGEELNNANRR